MEKVGYYNNRGKVFNNSGTKDFRTQDRKPLRYSEDSFVKELIGKTIQIELVNGKILKGKLLNLGMFDVLIELKSEETVNISGKPMVRDVLKNLIILKSAILTVEVLTK